MGGKSVSSAHLGIRSPWCALPVFLRGSFFDVGCVNMAALSPPPDERARKILQVIFQRLSSTGQSTVAQQLSVSEATVSRMKEDMPRFAGMLSALGLKVVPVEMKCYDEATLGSILQLAQQRMAQLQTPQQLAQDWDPE